MNGMTDDLIPNAEAIEAALVKRLYRSDTKLIQNDARGDWAEEIVGQVLGAPWRIVSSDWYPWDIECGPAKARSPERIRIQVRNSAALQTWDQEHPAQASYTIEQRRRPYYVKPDMCEDFGHLCEIYVLAWHGETDRTRCNHRDPQQWKFYVVAAEEMPAQKQISRPKLEKLFPASLVDVGGLKGRVEEICSEVRQKGALASTNDVKPIC